MDPYIPESTSPFGPGDRISLGTEKDSPTGTLLNLVIDSDEPVWIVSMDEGGEEGLKESALFLVKKAEHS